MQSIGSIIPKTVRRAGIDGRIVSSQVISIFERIKDSFLDSELSRQVQAVYFEDNILNIASLSTRATQDLTKKAEKIIEKLNDLVGQKVVEKIKIIV